MASVGVTPGGGPGQLSKEELLTCLSAQCLAQRLRGQSSLGRSPRNPGALPAAPGWAGLDCFGWLPPAYHCVTWRGSVARLP